MRFLSAVHYDLILQYRHYLYHVYVVVTALYVLALYLVPQAGRDLLLPVMIFADPAVLGFYFVAAMVLYEKDARTLQGLSVTPLRGGEYLLSKAVSLSVLSILASFALAVMTRGIHFNALLLVTGVGLTASTYVLIGFAVVARHDNLSMFLLDSILAMSVLGLPMVGYLGILRTPLYYALPGQPALLLIAEAFAKQPDLFLTAGSVALLLVWNVAAFVLAKRQFIHRIMRSEGRVKA